MDDSQKFENMHELPFRVHVQSMEEVERYGIRNDLPDVPLNDYLVFPTDNPDLAFQNGGAYPCLIYYIFTPDFILSGHDAAPMQRMDTAFELEDVGQITPDVLRAYADQYILHPQFQAAFELIQTNGLTEDATIFLAGQNLTLGSKPYKPLKNHEVQGSNNMRLPKDKIRRIAHQVKQQRLLELVSNFVSSPSQIVDVRRSGEVGSDSTVYIHKNRTIYHGFDYHIRTNSQTPNVRIGDSKDSVYFKSSEIQKRR